MANKPKTNTYSRKTPDGEKETLGAYVGSPLDDVLASDPDWERGGRTSDNEVAQKTAKVDAPDNTDEEQLEDEGAEPTLAQLRQIAAQRGHAEPEKLSKAQAKKFIAENQPGGIG